MIYLLDTDHMSLLEWGGSAESLRLRERLADLNPDQVAATIISYEEQMRGWMAFLARARSTEQRVEAYARLRRHLSNYCQVPIVDFDQAAAKRFAELRSQKIRIGTMDLQIAAIALANNATVLTRNSVDFEKVPELMLEDWSL